MFDVMNYADRNDVEVSIRKGHDGRTVWEIFLRDRRLDLTEFTRIIDIEIRGRLDQDAYIELQCEKMMDKIRSARMKEQYSEIEGKREERSAQQHEAAERIFLIWIFLIRIFFNADLFYVDSFDHIFDQKPYNSP